MLVFEKRQHIDRKICDATFHGNVVVAEDHLAFYPIVNLSLNHLIVRFSKVNKRIFVRLFHLYCVKALSLLNKQPVRKGFEFFVGDDGIELTVRVAADFRGVIIDNQTVLGHGGSATIQQPFRMF